MKSPLDVIEARLQSFIESSLNFLPGDRSQNALAHQLAAAIQQTLTQEPDGALVSNNQFIVHLHPNSLSIWESRPGLIDALIRVVNEAAREAGIGFFSPFNLQLLADVEVAELDFSIQVGARERKVEETGTITLLEVHPTQEQVHPNQAFLIMNGATILPLHLPVINLGRRQENQIVIDDPRVSRKHAQLRAIRGRYILLDLNSTGGTFINGIQITQQALKPGDVISLAGVQLIYGEEQLNSNGPSPRMHTGRLDIRHDPPAH
jgi:hypothetical protein